jgi:4-hydroxybenzoate polyprenyltransferase
LTKYWRMFKKRPIAAGLIKPKQALVLFFVLAAITLVLIASLPYPHSLYLFVIMMYCYAVECFYQIHKRNEKYPLAQLLGRTDFALFPVAGYLVVGQPDLTAVLYFVFFYPFAMAHLGANDLIDVINDKARDLKSVTVLYGLKGTALWILIFTLIHYVTGSIFAYHLGLNAIGIFVFGFVLLAIANISIMKQKTPQAALKVLPLFHVTMIIYSVSLIGFVIISGI